MRRYKVIVLKSAQKEVRRFLPKDRERIVEAITSLQFDPYVGKQLQGEHEGKWSLRVWPYRIVYMIEKQIVTVTVLRVGHRQGVYK